MIFRSPFPDIQIPDQSVTAFALRHAERLAGKVALVDSATGRTVTYGELARDVRRVAAGLRGRGYGRGDVVAIVAPNSIDWAVAFLAIAAIGGIAALQNQQGTPEEIGDRLRDLGAIGLVTTPDLLDRARAAILGSSVRDIVLFGEAPGTTPFASLLAGDAPFEPAVIDPERDIAAIFCSSGTTGLPKGVQITHRNLIAGACQFAATCDVAERDVLPGQLPLFHIFGLVVTICLGLGQGATSVLVSRFEFEPFLGLVQEHRITRAFLVPPIVLALAKHPAVDRYDLSSLVTLTCGAAPLGADVARACAERLGCRVKQGYGMTEIVPTHIAPEAFDPAKIGAVGPCVPGVECKILDAESGRELGPEELGEILARGPAATPGYLNRPDATTALIDAEGWVHTGDLGRVDADGFLTVVDRLKELIKYKAYQVAPAELEAILLAHSAVADAAVVPSPDDEAGEVPKAFVVLKGSVSAEELMDFVAARVAPSKKIRRLEIIDQIPKSPTGKLLRRVLVERERAAVPSPA